MNPAGPAAGDQAVRTSTMRRGEESEAARVAAAAFLEDPYWAAVGPDHRGLRRHVIETSTRADFRHGREHGDWLGVVREGDRLVGIARVAEEEAPEVGLLPPRWVVWCGLGGASRWRRAERSLRLRRPRSRYHYLYTLAVEPGRQGRGIGAALLRDAIAGSRERGLPLLLDTMTHDNVSYYEHFGFETLASFGLPRGQRAWVMEWRGDRGAGVGGR